MNENSTVGSIDPKQKARLIISDLQKEDTDNYPIIEVLDIQNKVQNGNIGGRGFLNYEQLAVQGKNRSLFRPDAGSSNNGVYVNLKSAYAESIVLKTIRDRLPPGYGVVQYEPTLNLASSIDGVLGTSVTNSFRGKTPDILLSAPYVNRREGNEYVVMHGVLPSVVDLNSLENIPRNQREQSVPLTTINYRTTNLVAPIEVTTSGRGGAISAKIAKFKSYQNLSDSKTSYVPVLVLDEYKFNKLSRKQQIYYAKEMKSVGGVIMLLNGLDAAAERRAIKAANRLHDRMNSNSYSQEDGNTPLATTLPVATGVKTENTSVTQENTSGKVESPEVQQFTIAQRKAKAIEASLKERKILPEDPEFKNAFVNVVKNLKNISDSAKQDICEAQGIDPRLLVKQLAMIPDR
jgi:hypothetical protein